MSANRTHPSAAVKSSPQRRIKGIDLIKPIIGGRAEGLDLLWRALARGRPRFREPTAMLGPGIGMPRPARTILFSGILYRCRASFRNNTPPPTPCWMENRVGNRVENRVDKPSGKPSGKPNGKLNGNRVENRMENRVENRMEKLYWF